MAFSLFLPNIINLVLLMIIARILLNKGMNDYSVVIGYVTMFTLVSDIGMAWVMSRDVSRDHSKMDKYFGTFFLGRLAIILAMIMITVALAGFMPYSPEIINFIYVAALSQLLLQVAQVFSNVFMAFEKMEYIAYGSILQSIVYFISGVIFVDKGLLNLGVAGIIYANLLSNMVMLLVYLYLSQKNIVRFRLDFDIGILKYLVFTGIPFAIGDIFTVSYSIVGRFILSILKYDEVANYALPYTFVMSLSFILTAYSTSVFPLFSKITAKKSDSIRYACEKSYKYLMILIFPMCVGATIFADRIVYTVYGEDFSGAIPVLQILIWILFFMIMSYIGFTLLSATHREKIKMYILAASALLNIGLNLLLIPRYGAIGASIAILLTFGLLNSAVILYFIRDDIKGVDVLGPTVKVVVATAAMTVAVLLVNVNNLAAYVAMGAAIYFITLLLIGGISKDDIGIAKKIVSWDERGLERYFKFSLKKS
jgi:O-antigen/teichoic acid export membrane protein